MQPTPSQLRVRGANPSHSSLQGTQPHTADDILGLSRTSMANTDHSLDIEIEGYLLDLQTGTSSLVFWQVRLFLLWCNLNDGLLLRVS
jgi:hypothetical protein